MIVCLEWHFHPTLIPISAISCHWLQSLWSFTQCGISSCNTGLAFALKATTDKLQWASNAAAGTSKFGHDLSRLLHSEPHLLDSPERILFTVGIIMMTFMISRLDTCPFTVCQSPSLLHNSLCDPPVVDFWSYRGTSWVCFDRWTFSVADLSVWNSLPDVLCDADIGRNRSKCTSLFNIL